MQVANLTTPTQYFHILRKQTLQDKKKPLIIMSPKSLLRHPQAVCNVEELATGSFHPFLGDSDVDDPKSIDRIVICSGKVYYDLYKEREENELKNVAITRLEQFYPFPDKDISLYLKEMKHVKEIIWCQEEPKNMGAWTFVSPRFQELLQKNQKLTYAGRLAAASPAAGQKKVHDAEQSKLITHALGI
jgi:2-oxoglutarate dehydrogenase E1 component